MMRVLHKIGAGIMVTGFIVVLVGGMSVRRGPDGTWVQVNLVHAVGGGLLLCGMVFTVLAALAGGKSNAELLKDLSSGSRTEHPRFKKPGEV